MNSSNSTEIRRTLSHPTSFIVTESCFNSNLASHHSKGSTLHSPAASFSGGPRFAAAHFYQYGAPSPTRNPPRTARWSSFSRDEDRSISESTAPNRSVNYLPQKFVPLHKSETSRWTKFKWWLFGANTVLTIYSFGILVFVLMTWLRAWDHADVVIIANSTPLALATAAGSICLFTCLLGWCGIFLNSRPILTAYNLMLWVCFAMIASVGYVSYKRQAFNLPGKLSEAWSRSYKAQSRLILQNSLHCCGYVSPEHQAIDSDKCFGRTSLPGCKSKFLKFERSLLTLMYEIAFAIVPFHIIIIISALLCSNHVNNLFGKGLIPKPYRLSMQSMAYIMDNYTSQLASMYGNDIVYGKGGIRDVIADSVQNSLSTSQLDLSIISTKTQDEDELEGEGERKSQRQQYKTISLKDGWSPTYHENKTQYYESSMMYDGVLDMDDFNRCPSPVGSRKLLTKDFSKDKAA